MQAITPELEAILKSHFQAAADGFRARLVVDDPLVPPPPPGAVTIRQYAFCNGSQIGSAKLGLEAIEGNTLIAIQFVRDAGPSPVAEPGAMLYGGFTRIGWTFHSRNFNRAITMDHHVVEANESPYTRPTPGNPYYPAGDRLEYHAAAAGHRLLVVEIEGAYVPGSFAVRENVASTTNNNTGGPLVVPTGDHLLVGASAGDNDTATTPFAGVSEIVDVLFAGFAPYCWCGTLDVVGDGIAAFEVGCTQAPAKPFAGIIAAFEPIAPTGGGHGSGSGSQQYQPFRISIDKSLNLVADQAEVELANEGLTLGWGPSSGIPTNSRCRIFQWYGDEANDVQTFDGLIDRVHDSRDPLRVVLTMRDRMAIAIDQTFSASAPQSSDEADPVRTPANGVYLSMEVSDIVDDLLDRVGWPTADRAITPTSYVLDEFVVRDGASYAETIIGKEQLTGLVGYSAWADELGIFHFAPTAASQNLTEPLAPAYTFRTGEDIVELDDDLDQYALRTRVKVRGPLTTQTLTDTWRELWRTTKISKPVGLWHDPAVPGTLRVISRSTKRLYRLRDSDQVVLGSSYLGAVIPHPLGLSGDPADSTIYWVLNAPWIYTGSTTGNSVKKVRKSDNVVLASYAIPNGRWSALKVSAAFMWLTNLDTDRFYKRSKTDASAIADYSHTYQAVVQLNPSGMMVDGTTLFLFWANGGTTARFLVCEEVDPTTITKVVKTAGSVLHGGEMNTITHTECWGDADSLNLVAKFTLLEAVDQTDEVFAEVVDIALEDELGDLAQLEPRVHDAHSGDPAHPYEVRRLTLDLSVITSLAQATETATRQLELASQRRRVLDAGIVGNPALQKTDVVDVEDPLTGIVGSFLLDTYRTRMDASGTYLGTVALLPIAALTDDPADDGDASE